MNNWGLLQSLRVALRASLTFARDPKYSWFHEPSKNRIHFLNERLQDSLKACFKNVNIREWLC